MPLEDRSLHIYAALHILATKATQSKRNWQRCEALVPHVIAGVARLETIPSGKDLLRAAANALRAITRSVSDLSYDSKFLNAFELRVDLCEKALGPIHPETLEAKGDLAFTLFRIGITDQAVIGYQSILEGEASDREKLHHMPKYATVLYAANREEEASAMMEKAQVEFLRFYGAEHPETWNMMRGRAYLLNRRGKHAEAIAVQKEMLSIARRTRGDDDINVLSANNNLALFYRDQGDSDMASTLQKEVVESGRNVLGSEHPVVVHWEANLACYLHNQGKHSQAASMAAEVKTKLRHLFGDQHPATLRALYRSANALHDQRFLDDEIVFRREILEGNQRALGDDHPYTVIDMTRYGIILHDVGRFVEAAHFKGLALEKHRQLYGNNNPWTIDMMHHMAATLKVLGRTDEEAALLAEIATHKKA